MLVYVCIGGVNVDNPDAHDLADLIGNTPVRLDLIEVTDSTGSSSGRNSTNSRDSAAELSERLRQPVVRRYSGGADIKAACGTLAGTG